MHQRKSSEARIAILAEIVLRDGCSCKDGVLFTCKNDQRVLSLQEDGAQIFAGTKEEGRNGTTEYASFYTPT